MLPELVYARIGLTADQPPYLISQIDQVLGQVSAILTGDTGDQRTSCQRSLRVLPSSRQLTDTGRVPDRPAYEWGERARKLPP
jgi:hypothetical protein